VIAIANNEAQQRYEVSVDGELAGFVQYRAKPGLIALIHTEIDDRFEGQGLGGRLIARVGPVGSAFGDRAAEPGLEVPAHFRRGVLAKGQGGRGVLDQQVQDPDRDLPQLRQALEHLGRDQMKAPRLRLQTNLPLDPDSRHLHSHGPCASRSNAPASARTSA